jgi:hypothetical protein
MAEREKKRKKRVPKGWSEYQAAWIIDSVLLALVVQCPLRCTYA